jgi:hypothetical protein
MNVAELYLAILLLILLLTGGQGGFLLASPAMASGGAASRNDPATTPTEVCRSINAWQSQGMIIVRCCAQKLEVEKPLNACETVSFAVRASTLR